MTEVELPDLLDRLADRVDPAVPPIDDMLRTAGRVRRRRATLTLAGAVVAVGLVGVGVPLVSGLGSGDPGPSVASGPTGAREPVPDGMHLVAIGHAAIAVPDSWGTNVMRCGTPTQDTVVIDVGAVELCGFLTPQTFDSVWLEHGGPAQADYQAQTHYEIDGVPAERSKTTCQTVGNGAQACTGTVHVPAEDAYFTATSATADGVDRILDRVRMLDGQVGVPGFQEADLQDDQSRAQETYVESLRALGLEPKVVLESHPGMQPGFVLGVEPGAGTVVEPGSTVTVTATAPPNGPADEVQVGVNSLHGEMGYQDLTDEQVRAGATIRLKVGDTIWAYADGKRAGTLVGELDGSTLAISTWAADPNLPHSWKVVSAGTTTVTLTITADGKRVVLGTVTVVSDQ